MTVQVEDTVVVGTIVLDDAVTVGAPVAVDDGPVVLKAAAGEQAPTVGRVAQLTGGLNGAALWSGEGPPGPDNPVIGASVGDEYLDELTGIVYRLDEG